MDKSLKESMLKYYDERASEYDEIYLYGKGSTAINNPKAYIDETEKLKEIVSKLCFGDIIDIPCGTGFWLQSYAKKCDSVILVDQSKKMIAEARQKAIRNGTIDRCRFIQTDIFDFDWPDNKSYIILTGFFLSHLTDEEETLFLNKAIGSLKTSGKLLVLDSAWSSERAAGSRKKEGKLIRELNDGIEFDIYKKYLDPDDIKKIGEKHNIQIEIHHYGTVFFAFSGKVK